MPEWWNWQTRQTQNLVPVTGGKGSTPFSGISFKIIFSILSPLA